MEHPRNILPSNYSAHQIPFHDFSGIPRSREPLSDSAGNAQLQTLDFTGHYHDIKGYPSRVETPMYSTPTLPSQPLRQPLANTLELRRQSTRRRRHLRFNRNPIVDSPQYQAYRDRQCRDGNPDDQKWPDILEQAFLDALIEMPIMKRRKYSYKGKPHGRNEMITEYLWIAYLQSLPPGATPDPAMRRERKQVSSHIQVLKGFFRDHPAFDRLFPDQKKGPENGFEDSFKNDPCLRAISEGRLPSKRLEQYEEVNQLFLCNIRPVVFWLLLDSSGLPPNDSCRDVYEEDLYCKGRVTHKFTGLSPLEGQRQSLESIPNWRRRFPYLNQLCGDGALRCDLIHMDVSLNLLQSPAPDGSSLLSKTLLAMPGRKPGDWEWRIVTTLSKPTELHRDPESDPPISGEVCPVMVISASNVETQIRITYPANSWANAFACLRSIQNQYEEQLRTQILTNQHPIIPPARDFVDQISMYYEVQSKTGQGGSWVTRAIILWTFHEAKEGEPNETTWRYLTSDPPPPRRICMSPSPHPSHHISASMNENFNHWAETPTDLSHQSMLDPFAQGLRTTPHAVGLQSPFAAPSSYGYQPNAYDLPGESLSFVSNTTLDSEATLVDTTDTTTNLSSYLSNSHIQLEYDPSVPAAWHLPASESFDTDPTWANYNVTSTQGWDSQDSQKTAWSEMDDGGKGMSWVDEKHDWGNVNAGDTNELKHAGHEHEIGVNVEEVGVEGHKLLPWIDDTEHVQTHQRNEDEAEMNNTAGYEELGAATTTEVEEEADDGMDTHGAHGTNHKSAATEVIAMGAKTEDDWGGEDGFNYAQLAERLK